MYNTHTHIHTFILSIDGSILFYIIYMKRIFLAHASKIEGILSMNYKVNVTNL